jgi:hypothetical protein
LQDGSSLLDDHYTGWALGLLQSATDTRDEVRHMRHLWLLFGWSALSIILLIPMSTSLRFTAVVCLFVAISLTDYLLTAWEIILEEVDRDPLE